MDGPGGTGGVLGARVHAEGASPVLVGRAYPDLYVDAAAVGQHQWGGQGQFLDHIAADLIGGPDGQLQQGRTRHQYGTLNDVVGQPRV